MRPRRTHSSTHVFVLQSGNEDNDLWAHVEMDGHTPVICTVWVPTHEEREAIASGENILLMVWGTGIPPLGMETTREPIGKKPE